MKRVALLFLPALLALPWSAAAHDNHVVKLLAGSPGYDHIQPFMAEKLGFWDKYGVKVEFIGGNYIRANNMMSTGDFDVGYNQYANAIRYFAAGIPNVIVGSSSANCAVIIAKPEVKSWADLKGKRIGMVTKFDVQWMTMTEHILPRFGLSEKDVQLALVPVPEVATAILTGDVWAAFPFEPYGTNAVQKGAKILLTAKDMIDKSKIQSDMLRNGLTMHRKFVKDHPDLAKKVVWAHMDAVDMMRRDKKTGIDVIKHYNPNMDPKLIEDSYDNCGWQYQTVPKVWIETLVAWMKKADIIQKDVKYEEVTDFSLQEGYSYPGWEKMKKK
ncbi:MAG TPA: ABC transporter substrate-binding protein [Methylomirabilota bacterium]|jgi:ABC-type nitrate/sulfonate/bicarbonate transport system substrate-binding protein|nr:ABC transporter substrate-binding protein [Methylomirabilota bacterium]